LRWRKNIKENISNFRPIMKDFWKIKYKNQKKLPMMQLNELKKKRTKSGNISNIWKKVVHLLSSITSLQNTAKV
jgi:hypothetical protein